MAHEHRGRAPVTTFPDIFDKARLKGDEFKKYIYEIPFKIKGGGTKTARGMTAAGNVHAIHPYLKSINSELLHYGTVGQRNIMCCVVKVTVTINSKSDDSSDGDITVSALADGDVTGVPSADTLVRTVETRALNRALERLLDISKADLNANGNDEPDEEEYGTPIHHPEPAPGSLTAKMKAKKDKEEAARKKLEEEEDDDDNQTDEGGLSGNAEDETAKGSDDESGDDW